MNDPNTPSDDTAHDTGESDDQPRVPDDRPGVQDARADDGSTNAEGQIGAAETSGDTGSKLVAAVEYATFGILCLLALVATFRFYFAASEAVRVWFSSDFVPVFQAAFNLVVLVAAALGISVLVRRIG